MLNKVKFSLGVKEVVINSADDKSDLSLAVNEEADIKVLLGEKTDKCLTDDILSPLSTIQSTILKETNSISWISTNSVLFTDLIINIEKIKKIEVI